MSFSNSRFSALCWARKMRKYHSGRWNIKDWVHWFPVNWNRQGWDEQRPMTFSYSRFTPDRWGKATVASILLFLKTTLLLFPCLSSCLLRLLATFVWSFRFSLPSSFFRSSTVLSAEKSRKNWPASRTFYLYIPRPKTNAIFNTKWIPTEKISFQKIVKEVSN